MSRRPTKPIPEASWESFYLAAWDLALSGQMRTPSGSFGMGNHTARRHGLAILWCTAIAARFSEVRRLKFSDVSLRESTVYVVRSKKGKSGDVRISPDLVKATLQWRTQRTATLTSTWLLPTRNGGQLSCDVFNRDICKPLGELFGLRLSSHCFRDTACQMAMASSQDVRKVQKHMGHTNAITTQHYLNKFEPDAIQLALFAG